MGDLIDILADVADPIRSPPMRPAMPPGVPAFFLELIHRCWNPEPEARPSFETISADLRYADAPTLINTLLARMEATARDTALVRTMFPPTVAAALREGRKVEPESFSAVTMFFSDVVGFTDLSSSLPPELVTDMLTRLYTAFDKLAIQYGLWKLEVIGDAVRPLPCLRPLSSSKVPPSLSLLTPPPPPCFCFPSSI